ncbi:hypothetical protein EDD18DRAFT_1154716, partial [Armillaria luteobubalina]
MASRVDSLLLTLLFTPQFLRLKSYSTRNSSHETMLQDTWSPLLLCNHRRRNSYRVKTVREISVTELAGNVILDVQIFLTNWPLSKRSGDEAPRTILLSRVAFSRSCSLKFRIPKREFGDWDLYMEDNLVSHVPLIKHFQRYPPLKLDKYFKTKFAIPTNAQTKMTRDYDYTEILLKRSVDSQHSTPEKTSL